MVTVVYTLFSCINKAALLLVNQQELVCHVIHRFVSVEDVIAC